MQRNTLLLIVRYECFKNVSYVTGSITKFKKSVGWTIDKFWLNNSMVINGMILSFAYQKNGRPKTYVFKFLGFLL